MIRVEGNPVYMFFLQWKQLSAHQWSRSQNIFLNRTRKKGRNKIILHLFLISLKCSFRKGNSGLSYFTKPQNNKKPITFFVILTLPLDVDGEHFDVCSVKAFLTSNDICCESFKLQMMRVFSKLIHCKGLNFNCRFFFFCLISLESYNCISLLYLQHIKSLPLLSSHSSSFGLFLSAASNPFGFLYLNQKWKLQWQGDILSDNNM